MAVYIIGDIQGCYKELKKLLKVIQFDAQKDRLWFVGDLVNRGPNSLKTLRFIRSLGDRAVTVLGNHDLHLLASYYAGAKLRSSDTISEVIKAEECDELMSWLRSQPLMHFEAELNFALVHAGIYPGWSIPQARQYALEVEARLQGKNFKSFLREMYGNKPVQWSEELTGMPRLRFITNVFTRMRYLKHDKSLDLTTKGAPDKSKLNMVKPWFEFGQKSIKHNRVAFGHWSTLATGQYGNSFALDSGCLWGGRLTALRIDKRTPRWYGLPCKGAARIIRKSSS